jgi:hypothetical protein
VRPLGLNTHDKALLRVCGPRASWHLINPFSLACCEEWLGEGLQFAATRSVRGEYKALCTNIQAAGKVPGDYLNASGTSVSCWKTARKLGNVRWSYGQRQELARTCSHVQVSHLSESNAMKTEWGLLSPDRPLTYDTELCKSTEGGYI